jgi:HlyD family secretion protein
MSVKTNKKKGIKLTVIIATALALVVAALALGARKGPSIVKARMETVKAGPLEERVSASGTFQSERVTVVMSTAAGKVRSVRVKPGDRVKAGDIIIEIDDKDARQALNTAEIALEESRRNALEGLAEARSSLQKCVLALDQAKRAYQADEKLRAVDGVSGERLLQSAESAQQAQFALDGARERLCSLEGLTASQAPIMEASRDDEFARKSPAYRRAMVSYEAAQRAVSGCVIRSEGSGTVTDVSVAVGNALELMTLVARIEDLSSVVAEVNVDEMDVGKLTMGMRAEVTADSLLGKTLSGRVLRVWPIVKSDGNGRVCKVQVKLDPNSARVLSGATCMARMTSRLKDSALLAPASALIPGSKPNAVWVLTPVTGKGAKPGQYRAAKREIQVGLSTAREVEVSAGLRAGDTVATDGLPAIKDGGIVMDGGQGDDKAHGNI